MAKAWIYDKWLKSAQITTADGHRRKVETPPSSVKRSLAMYADEPGKAKVPDDFRSTDFGKGERWEVRWRIDGTGRRKLFRYRADAEAFMAEIEDRGYARTGTRTPGTPAGRSARWRTCGSMAGTVKGSTEGRYRRELRCWVLPKWGEVALKDITTVGIQHWYVELAEGTAPYAGKWGLRLPAVRVLDPLGGQDRSGPHPGRGGGEPVAGDQSRGQGESAAQQGRPTANIPDPAGDQNHRGADGRGQRHGRLPARVHGTANRQGPGPAVRGRGSEPEQDQRPAHPVGRCQLPPGGDPAEGKQDQVRADTQPAAAQGQSLAGRAWPGGVPAARARGRKAEHRELAEPGMGPGPAGRGHEGYRGPGHPLPAPYLRLPNHQGRRGREDPLARPRSRLDHRDPGNLRGPMAQPHRRSGGGDRPGYPNLTGGTYLPRTY